jgi:hypothetical protein
MSFSVLANGPYLILFCSVYSLCQFLDILDSFFPFDNIANVHFVKRMVGYTCYAPLSKTRSCCNRAFRMCGCRNFIFPLSSPRDDALFRQPGVKMHGIRRAALYDDAFSFLIAFRAHSHGCFIDCRLHSDIDGCTIDISLCCHFPCSLLVKLR